MTPIDTRRANQFRKLRFETIDECFDEIERIRIADERGTLQPIGNLTPGQNLAHLAAWIEYGYDGYPIGAPPFFVRWFLRFKLSRMLRDGMPRGVRIPGVKNGTTGADQMTTADAVIRLRNAWQRLKNREPAPFESPAFGAMSHDDRVRLNLRHAELHLGYLLY